jgi:hypothetical protein
MSSGFTPARCKPAGLFVIIVLTETKSPEFTCSTGGASAE